MTSVGRSVRTDGTGRVDQSWDEPTRRGSSFSSLSVVASSYFNRVLLLLLFAVDVLVWIRNVFLTGWAVQGSGGSGCLSLLIWRGRLVRSFGRSDGLARHMISLFSWVEDFLARLLALYTLPSNPVQSSEWQRRKKVNKVVKPKGKRKRKLSPRHPNFKDRNDPWKRR